MKTFYAVLIVISFSFVALSQDYSLEYGKVTNYELTLASYPYDKNASAAVLFDIGKSSFLLDSSDNFDVVFERSTKIKIFTEAGLKYAEIEIPFYRDNYNSEKVTGIEATTYNLVNGETKTTRIDPKNTFTEKINENWNLLKFAIPNVKPGSVIEYKYTLTSPYKFNLHDWQFQSDIPVKYSKYVTAMIPFYTYTYLLQGASKFDSYNSYEGSGITQRLGSVEYRELFYEYIMTNLPAFVDEGFMTSKDDYIIKIDFQLSAFYNTDGVKTDVVSTWPILSNELLKDTDFGKFIGASQGKNKELIEKLKSENSTDIQLLEALVDNVKQNYSWNGIDTKYPSQSVKEFEKTKIGNSAELNLYLLALLTDAGLVANPVILSTRQHGKIKADIPFLDFFNYVLVLVKVGTENLLVDATEPLLPYNLIPPKCINEQGFIVQKKIVEWVSLTNTIPSLLQTNIKCEFNPSLDSVRLEYIILTNRYDAFNLRKEINDVEKNLATFIEEKELSQFTNVVTKNFSERNKSYVIAFNGSIPSETIMNKIYLSPFIFEPIDVNPLKQPERKYPIDLTYAKSREYTSTITIPEGYKIEFLPANKQIDDNNFSLTYQTTTSDDGKSLFISGKYTFKKAVYDAKDYGLLRYYYTELVKKLNEKIVFVKQ